MNLKIVAIFIFIFLLFFVTTWQFYAGLLGRTQEDYNVNPTSTINKSDTIESILDDLSQIPDASSLNSELDSLNKNIEGF